MKKDPVSLLPSELEEELLAMGEPKYRAAQIFRWLGRGVRSFDGMSDLPKALRTAVEYTVESIRCTVDDARHNWYGVDFESAFPLLLKLLSE